MVTRSISLLYQQVKLCGNKFNFEIDSGANDTICTKDTWIKVGKLKVQPVEDEYKVANGNPLQVLGQFEVAPNWMAKLEAKIRRWLSLTCLKGTYMYLGDKQ